MFCCAWHRLHVTPYLHSLVSWPWWYVFPCFIPVALFSSLSTGFVLSCSSHLLHIHVFPGLHGPQAFSRSAPVTPFHFQFSLTYPFCPNLDSLFSFFVVEKTDSEKKTKTGEARTRCPKRTSKNSFMTTAGPLQL